MSTDIFAGGSHDWFTTAGWQSLAYPVAGETAVIASGTAVITAADVAQFGSLDQETLLIGGSGSFATLSTDDETFGINFTLNAEGTSNQAVLAFAGLTTFDGSIDISGTHALTDLLIGSDPSSADTATLVGPLTVGGGASLAVDGGTLDIAGTAAVSDGLLTIGADGTLTGTGTILIGAAGTLVVAGSALPGLHIDFTAPTGTLVIGGNTAFHADVAGIEKGDLIDLPAALNTLEYNQTTGVVALRTSGTKSAVLAAFTLTGTISDPTFYLGPEGTGGSSVVPSLVRNWNGGTGDFYATNWTNPPTGSNAYPEYGDRPFIVHGTVEVTASDAATHGSLDNLSITLGGTAGAAVPVLQVDDAVFGPNLSIHTGGSFVAGELITLGSVVSNGLIDSEANGGVLTIDIPGPGNQFINLVDGTLSTGADGALVIQGGELTNQGVLAVAGGLATITATATLDGSGQEVITQGGELSIAGSVAATQAVVFDDQGVDGDELVIASGAQFQGIISGFVQGDTIDVAGVVATGATYAPASGILTLTGAGGATVGTLHLAGGYGTADFGVTGDGSSGSFISDIAPSPEVAALTLPTDAFLATGATISLQQLLLDAFGSIPAGYDTLTLSSESAADLLANSYSYWDPNDPSLSGWIIGGTALAPDTKLVVTASEFGTIDFVAGNDISPTATLAAQVGTGASGAVSAIVDYAVQTIPPALAGPASGTGTITPADIVASASLFATTYAGVANSNDCGFIAAANAAAEGAALSDAASTNPEDNNAGGFWRVVYRGSDPNPVANWGTIVQAGDIVRMEHDTGGPHSTTILQTLTNNGTDDIQVFDNGDNAPGYSSIGIHDTNLGYTTVPANTTIFRLDPDNMYLVIGEGSGAFVQGSTYDNLIVLDGSADIVAAGAAENLIVAQASIWQGATVTDFHSGDTLDLTSLNPTGATPRYNAATGELTITGSGQTVAIALPTGLSGDFVITPDGGTLAGTAADGAIIPAGTPAGTNVRAIDGGDLGVLYTGGPDGTRVPINLGAGTGSMLELVACYAAGTRILTERGEIPVEALRVGERVWSLHGGMAPIRWIGHRRIRCRRHRQPDLVWPVRVNAGAFGEGVPRRALSLSPDHAVFSDGVLIPIKHLINGCSIAQVEVDEVEYWHVELQRHDVLRAEGLAAESYLDTGNRAAFAENGDHVRLHPEFAASTWDDACAELVQDGPLLAAVKERLFRRANLPAARPALSLTALADGIVLRAEILAPGQWQYTVPRGVRAMHLVSPGWLPAACDAASLDRRTLGVRLFGLDVDGRSVDLASPTWSSGFHPTEYTSEGACRWTNGDARLVLPFGARHVTLWVGDGAVPRNQHQVQSEHRADRGAHGKPPAGSGLFSIDAGSVSLAAAPRHATNTRMSLFIERAPRQSARAQAR